MRIYTNTAIRLISLQKITLQNDQCITSTFSFFQGISKEIRLKQVKK